MKAVVLAWHNMGCTGIESLREAGFEIAAVFTHRNDPGEKIWFRSAAELSASLGIPTFAPDDINHPIWVKRIEEMKPDIMFSFQYKNMVGSRILDIPKLGAVNVHDSLLPRYRGKCSLGRALMNGENETGVTLHYMTPSPEDGDIIAQEVISITPQDTARTLVDKATETAAGMLRKNLPLIKSGKAPRREQDYSAATFYGEIKAECGEIDWTRSSTEIWNLVRAMTSPYSGAFSFRGEKKCTLWAVVDIPRHPSGKNPGTIISLNPFVVACGKGAVQIEQGQTEEGVCVTGTQLASELNIVEGMTLGGRFSAKVDAARKKSILILGVNGFIGNALAERLLETGRYEVHGMDLRSNYLDDLRGRGDFYFFEGDISVHREWIEYHIKRCDIVLPLVAIATPIEYTRNPLKVFELDFEENLRVVRYCAKYGKRIIFPSTSEVYGMCDEEEFDEDDSRLITGPIRMQRWIYSCSKQLLDRVIWAYGDKEGLDFTLFRPFNWIGPKLDSLSSARIGSSRAITQLILNLVEGTPIQLIDGGLQKRCFTDLSDGIEGLFRIIENRDGLCSGRIFNIGNPDNEASIRELAELLLDIYDRHPLRSKFPPFAGIKEVESGSYYGRGYQDVQHRRPSIRNAKRYLDWTPTVGLKDSVEQTLDFFLRQAISSGYTA